ncbi:MAG TPA: universal stress protein [Spirochaetia bacterium]|nr:universal stress protein [Spirochaetia bacterium]
MYKKIMVPLDGSTAAEAVLDHVRKIAGEGTEVVLVRIAAKPAYEYTLQEPQLSACLDEDAAGEAGQYLSEVAARLKRSGLDVSTCVLPEQGPAARVLEDYAHKATADLIAISAHGKPGLIGRLLGSVAERIVHHGRIPVLLVHP